MLITPKLIRQQKRCKENNPTRFELLNSTIRLHCLKLSKVHPIAPHLKRSSSLKLGASLRNMFSPSINCRFNKHKELFFWYNYSLCQCHLLLLPWHSKNFLGVCTKILLNMLLYIWSLQKELKRSYIRSHSKWLNIRKPWTIFLIHCLSNFPKKDSLLE